MRETLAYLLAPVMPVRIEGDIHYLLSEVDDGWILTLINNARPLNAARFAYDTDSHNAALTKPQAIREAEFRLADAM